MPENFLHSAEIADCVPLMDEFQAGRYIGGERSPVSPRTLQRWRLEGTGPKFVSVGRLIRYQRSSLDLWLSSRVRQSTSERAAV